jgi:peptide chain release factor subunit 1
MAVAVTSDLLRELAEFRASNGCALSLFLDLDPSVAATTPEAEARFRSALSSAEKEAERRAGDRDCRLALRDDLAQLERWWYRDFDRDGTRGVALFASSADGFFRAVPLSRSIPDAVHVAADLYLSPLVDRYGGEGVLVAVVSREQGRVYRVREDRLEEILDESEEQPGQHDQGGWSQSRYQRHIEHLVAQHLRTVGDALRRRAYHGAELVVVMPPELRTEFVRKLSAESRAAIAGWTTADAHAGPAELLDVVRPVLDEIDARRHQELLERFRSELGRGGRATAGWDDTIGSAADGAVDVLLLTEGSQQQVWQCPDCRRAYVEEGTCAIDGIALTEQVDGGDVAIHHVLANGGEVLRYGDGALDDTDGVAALLRY